MAMTTTVTMMLKKATELEGQAVALRTAAEILSGMAGEQKRARVARTVGQAVALRRAQKNGHAPDHDPNDITFPAPTPAKAKATRRADKAATVVGIIRDYGKPMPLAKLKAAARAQGIDSLTGMIAYVRGGMLAKSGHKGKTRYRFLQMPDAS